MFVLFVVGSICGGLRFIYIGGGVVPVVCAHRVSMRYVYSHLCTMPHVPPPPLPPIRTHTHTHIHSRQALDQYDFVESVEDRESGGKSGKGGSRS